MTDGGILLQQNCAAESLGTRPSVSGLQPTTVCDAFTPTMAQTNRSDETVKYRPTELASLDVDEQILERALR